MTVIEEPPVRVGVIGVGRMGAVHARLLSAMPAVERLVLFDLRAAEVDRVAGELGAAVAPDLDGLLAGVDAVVVATGTRTHADLVERAVAGGVPTLCEKPLAPDLPATDRLLAVIERQGGRVQVGFQRRFDPGYAAARDLMADGKLGRLYLVRATSNDAQPPPAAFVPTSGGLHADVQVHDFDLVRYVTGDEVVEVYAMGSVLVEDYFGDHGDVDVGAVLLRLASSALAVATATRHNAHGYDVHMELFGSRDSVVVGLDRRLPLRRVEDDAGTADPYVDFVDRFRTAYRRELEAFLAFAAGGSDNPCPPADARAALRIVVACDRSRAERRPVRVEEVA